MKYTSDDGFLGLVAEPADGASSSSTAPRPAGVVEVSLQGERDELAALAARGLADDSYAYVACMAVDERARRRGVAKALLAAAERAAARWRQNWVLLHVHTDNEAAVKLYEACGYTRLDGDAGGGDSANPLWASLNGVLRGRPKALLGKVAGASPRTGAGAVMSIRADLLAALGQQQQGDDA